MYGLTMDCNDGGIGNTNGNFVGSANSRGKGAQNGHGNSSLTSAAPARRIEKIAVNFDIVCMKSVWLTIIALVTKCIGNFDHTEDITINMKLRHTWTIASGYHSF